MGLPFSPAPGEVLWCDFEAEESTPFHPPEMTKPRRVVVLSPRNRTRRAETIVVVPLSMTDPDSIEPHHYKLTAQYPFLKMGGSWVKGDMVRHVSVKRLRPFLEHNQAVQRSLSAEDLRGARTAVAAAIGVKMGPAPGNPPPVSNPAEAPATQGMDGSGRLPET